VSEVLNVQVSDTTKLNRNTKAKYKKKIKYSIAYKQRIDF